MWATIGQNQKACSPETRLRKFWRNLVADERPDEKERIRRERIDNIMQNVVLLEAMRRWEVETRGY
jgi:hypothetical protein